MTQQTGQAQTATATKGGGSGFLTTKSPDFADPAPVPVPGATDIKKESNPFTDRDLRMLAYAYVGFLLRILLVCGAVFSILQYLTAREEKRIERTLELVDMWDRTEYQDAQKALRARLVALNNANQSMLSSNPTETERQVYQAAIGEKLMTDEGGDMPLADVTQHFERIVYFFNRLGTCLKGNLCDQSVADDYFKDYALVFWSYFSGYITELRQTVSPGFASSFEEYVKSVQPPAEK